MTKISLVVIMAILFFHLSLQQTQARVISSHCKRSNLSQQHNQKRPVVNSKRTVSKHFLGRGNIIWNEIGVAQNNYSPFVQKAKASNLSYVVIKAFDGKEWGIKVNGRFKSQLSEKMIRAFHHQGIKCYGYGSTYLYSRSNVNKAGIHAINLLHKTSVDGLVMDDVFAYGSDAKKAKKLFSSIRHHMEACSRCNKKTLSFSTFPHLHRRDLPWEIPFQYCDYYLPQLYWADWNKTPEQVLSKFQSDWSDYKRVNKNIHTQVIPVAPTSRNPKVTTKELMHFTMLCRSAGYHNVAYYRLW